MRWRSLIAGISSGLAWGVPLNWHMIIFLWNISYIFLTSFELPLYLYNVLNGPLPPNLTEWTRRESASQSLIWTFFFVDTSFRPVLRRPFYTPCRFKLRFKGWQDAQGRPATHRGEISFFCVICTVACFTIGRGKFSFPPYFRRSPFTYIIDYLSDFDIMTLFPDRGFYRLFSG